MFQASFRRTVPRLVRRRPIFGQDTLHATLSLSSMATRPYTISPPSTALCTSDANAAFQNAVTSRIQWRSYNSLTAPPIRLRPFLFVQNHPNLLIPRNGTQRQLSSDSKNKKMGEQGRLSAIADSLRPTLKRVAQWNTGDLVSVYGIVIFILVLVFSPFIIE